MSKLPMHIAMIMDGNGRWANHRQRPRGEGHGVGSQNAMQIIQACCQRDIKILTLYAFSTENFKRPEPEVETLFQLFYQSLEQEMDKLSQLKIRIRIIGDAPRLGNRLLGKIREVEKFTQHNTGLQLVIALGYSGQWDILQATRTLAQEIAQGELQANEITVEQFSKKLQLSDLPAPDLCIRTGGEYRISNFLLWHLAYSELYFTPTLWPDFDAKALDEAIKVYMSRDRRLGVLHATTT